MNMNKTKKIQRVVNSITTRFVEPIEHCEYPLLKYLDSWIVKDKDGDYMEQKPVVTSTKTSLFANTIV